MSEAIRVRGATESDVEFLMATEREAESAAHWSEEQYRKIFVGGAPRVCLVIVEVKEAVGFVVVRTTESEWEIENTVIQSAARRRGLGSRLLDEVIDLSRKQGVHRLLLEARASNVAAQGLYEKCGFLQVGRRTNYYANPREDAVLFEFLVSQQP